MTPSVPVQQGLFRISAMLVLSGYVAIMAPMLRQDFQIAALGDTLIMQRRDVDAQLEQNDREIQAAKKRREDTGYLKDERHTLNLQGIQATREIQDWKVRKSLWTGMYWSLFALAHAVLLPLGFWLLAAGLASGVHAKRLPPSRKRAARTPRSRPRLVEGTDSR